MLIEVNSKCYNHQFPESPHPYISDGFITLNKEKAGKLIRLVESETKTTMGFIASLKNGILRSPFSAPFGGFHFRHDNVYVSDIEKVIDGLLEYAEFNELKKIELILPPNIYHLSFNTKLINVLIRKGFEMRLPEITNWIDLLKFSGIFSNRVARKFYQQSIHHELNFSLFTEPSQQKNIYDIIYQNRKKFGRPIYMTFEDLQQINYLWPVDFFGVTDEFDLMIAGGVFYRGHKSIVQGIFWGDSEEGRTKRPIDFLSLNIWNHYKKSGFEAIDLGISTEDGIPNEGLIRFKESHDCNSSLRFSFCWENTSLF